MHIHDPLRQREGIEGAITSVVGPELLFFRIRIDLANLPDPDRPCKPSGSGFAPDPNFK
jgi:hypothetical protein